MAKANNGNQWPINQYRQQWRNGSMKYVAAA
jgi:hypothetical protein